MANEIRTKSIAKAAFTKTLASLANGSGRQTTMVANSNNYPGAIVYVKAKSNSAPTVGTTYDVYLLRGDDASSSTYRSDGAGASDAGLTILNAQLLGSITLTASATTDFYGEFDTGALGPLGPEWGVCFVNRSGQSLGATEGDHLLEYVYYVPEVQ